MFSDSAIRVSPENWPQTPYTRKVKILLLALLPLVLASAPEVPQELTTFLRDSIGFTGKELANLQRAEAAKVLLSE